MSPAVLILNGPVPSESASVFPPLIENNDGVSPVTATVITSAPLAPFSATLPDCDPVIAGATSVTVTV